MRTPLSSCHKNLTLASRGDGGRSTKGSVRACASGTVALVPSRLVCDPVRGRRDGGEMIAGDEVCGWAGSGVKAENFPLLPDVLAGSEV
jgi:hypothetical protein